MDSTPLENMEKIYILSETHELLTRKMEESIEKNEGDVHSLSLNLYKIEKELKNFTGNTDIQAIKKQVEAQLIFPYL